MAKPTGAICNLDCQYCFYLAKAEMYPGGRFRMSNEVMEQYVKQLLEAHDVAEVTLAWQGGEPTLMGLDFFRRVVETAERHRRPGQRLLHTLQTNATLLDEEWAKFLSGHGFLVGVSLDGPPELHDVYRVDKKGRPTSSRVLRGLRLLREHKVEYNLLCTVHAANVDFALEVYRYLRDECGGRFLQFIPIVEHSPTGAEPDAVSPRTVAPEKWGRFLIDVFDEWLRYDVGSVFVQAFDAAVAAWVGVAPGVCIFSETCGDAVALEHNGDVYSCDHFVSSEHLLGNITTTHLVDMLGSEAQRRFGTDKRDQLPTYCMNCDVRFACWGECPKNRFSTTPDGEAGLNYLCAGSKAFFHHIDGPMRLIRGLLSENRPASDVYATFAHAGRNSPCPCGSGRKAKRCHGVPPPQGEPAVSGEGSACRLRETSSRSPFKWVTVVDADDPRPLVSCAHAQLRRPWSGPGWVYCGCLVAAGGCARRLLERRLSPTAGIKL